jgi:hypothetical protein
MEIEAVRKVGTENQSRVVQTGLLRVKAYLSDANTVLMGEGRSFKYEFDWRRASMPALAAVSPNRATGPDRQSACPKERHGLEPWMRAAPSP